MRLVLTSSKPPKLSVVSNDKPKTPKNRQGSKWAAREGVTDYYCPACMAEDGVKYQIVAVPYLGAVQDGALVTIRFGKKRDVLICPRCVRRGRIGKGGEPGGIAFATDTADWSLID